MNADILGNDIMLARHPGPASTKRVHWSRGRCSREVSVRIAQGNDLYDTLIEWVSRCGADGVAFRLEGGGVERLHVMTGKPETQTGRVATFHGPHVIECPARIVGGHGIIGTGPCGPVLHTHAVFESARGNPMGCHLIRGSCVAAVEGIDVTLFPLHGARFVPREDLESQFELLHPEAVECVDWPAPWDATGRVLLVKLQPNQDVYLGLEQACVEANLESAEVLSGVGSLNAAFLLGSDPTESARIIDGPGLEIAGISGRIEVGRGDDGLSAWVTRMDGRATVGHLQRGRNIVCITFEFVLKAT